MLFFRQLPGTIFNMRHLLFGRHIKMLNITLYVASNNFQTCRSFSVVRQLRNYFTCCHVLLVCSTVYQLYNSYRSLLEIVANFFFSIASCAGSVKNCSIQCCCRHAQECIMIMRARGGPQAVKMTLKSGIFLPNSLAFCCSSRRPLVLIR